MTLERWIAQAEAEEWELANAFIIESIDLQNDRRTFIGPLWSATEALAHAEKYEAEMQATVARGEKGWKCVVHPLWEPDPA